MNSLQPKYRIKLNKNLLVYPQFIDYLRYELHSLIVKAVLQRHLNLEEVYKFTIQEIPVQWGSYVMPKVRQVDALPEDKVDPKWKRISEILLQLDPLNPVPVDLEFTLGEIITFVVGNARHYQEMTPGGVVDYFGIETQMWFDDYPIPTGTVLKAVDFGTLDNYPAHLFDSAFMVLRGSLMDLFAQFVNGIKEMQNMVVTNNVDVQAL